MRIRSYERDDYDQLLELYRTSDEFEVDDVTDSKEMIERKVSCDPESVLVAEDGERLLGSASIIEDGRIAMLFRLVARDNDEQVLSSLLEKAESILKGRGYTELHCVFPESIQNTDPRRIKQGFQAGNAYRWHWKRLS